MKTVSKSALLSVLALRSTVSLSECLCTILVSSDLGSYRPNAGIEPPPTWSIQSNRGKQ